MAQHLALRRVDCGRFERRGRPHFRGGPKWQISLLLPNGFCPFTQNLQITWVSEHAGSALARNLLGYAEANQVVQGNCLGMQELFDKLTGSDIRFFNAWQAVVRARNWHAYAICV